MMTGPQISSPLQGPMDLVIPWVNYASPNYYRVIFGEEPTCVGPFAEIQWQLRSHQKWGLLDHFRHVYVVHSDLHDPPSFLRADHPQLSFVRHSQIVRDPGYLPLSTREAITAHVKNIPGLSDWFLYAADDNIVQQPWDRFVALLWSEPDGQLIVHTTNHALTPANLPAAMPSAWLVGAYEAAYLLGKHFGKRPRFLDTHEPHLLSKAVLNMLEQQWADSWERTRRSRHTGHISVEVMHDEWLIDSGQAMRRHDGGNSKVGALHYGRELHTNDVQLRPPVTSQKVALLQRLLNTLERNVVFLNLQGPGISDEYEPAPEYREVVQAWLERHFPKPSRFEAG